MHKKFEFEYEVFDQSDILNKTDLELLVAARKATETAFAPYSNFKVGAAVWLSNGQMVTGSNQESTSFPVGICAERTLLNAVGSQFMHEKITTMAISYHPIGKESNEPLSPCGMCRQSLLDYENRYQGPIRIILSGLTGPVWIFKSATLLLPFGFNGEILKGLK
jgi:cytidine deaminase